MAKKKVITMLLLDGEVNGRIKVDLKSSNIDAYKIPRELLSECKDIAAFSQSGVYLLFGGNCVYVGQAEVRKNGKGIHQRIMDHENDRYKDVWDEVVVFTRENGSLGRTDISYLENRMYNAALSAGRYEVQNGQEPTMGTVTEEKEIELEQFMEEAELILCTMGYKVFEPFSEVELKIKGDSTSKSIRKTKKRVIKPELPVGIEKVGEFVKQSIINLQNSGFEFSDEELAVLFDAKKCKEIFNMQSGDGVPFFKIYDENEKNPHIVNGQRRYYAPNPKTGKNIFVFGNYKLLFTKEWFPDAKYHQRDRFIEWYNNL